MPRQSSFATGEIDPALYGRTELAQYANALRKCRNTIVTPTGALMNRPGTRLCAPAKTGATVVRVVPFNFGSQNYVLEVGYASGGYIRVYQNGARVGTVEVATPYLESEIFNLKFAQSGDVMMIMHGSHPLQELKRISHLIWTISAPTLFAAGTVLPPPAAAATLDQTGETAYPARAFEWGFTCLDKDGKETRISPVLRPLASTSISTDVKVVRYQDKPAIGISFLVPVEFAQVRVYGGRNGVWGFLGYATKMVPTTVPVLSRAGYVQMYFEDVGDDPDFSVMPPTNLADPFEIPAWQSYHEYMIGDLVTCNGNVYQALVKGVSGATAPSGTGANITDGASAAWAAAHSYSVDDLVTNYGGTYRCTDPGLSSSKPGPYKEDYEIDQTDGLAKWRWLGRGGAVQWAYVSAAPAPKRYPYCGTYFEQRRILGGGDAQPARLLCSRTGNYVNFSKQGLNLVDTDAIDILLASLDREEIRSILSLRSMVVLTDQGFWSVGGVNAGPFTPTSIDAHRHIKVGASWLDPLVVGPDVVYVTATNNDVQLISYQALLQMFEGESLTEFSRHYFEGHQIVDWCYQRRPFGIVWLVREDGVLLGVTLNKTHKVVGWHQHDTGDGDKFESTCSVTEEAENAVYFVVNRQEGGSWVRYIERMSNRVYPRLADGTVDLPSPDVTLLDCADTQTDFGSWTGTYTRATSLVGRPVSMTVDGLPIGPYTSEDGNYDLSTDVPQAPTRALVSGLLVRAQGRLLPVFEPNRDVRSTNKSVTRVSVEAVDTLGLAFGNTLEDCDREWSQRTVEGGLTPFTGVDHVRIDSGFDHDGDLAFEQPVPLPFTIVAIEREMEYGDD